MKERALWNVIQENFSSELESLKIQWVPAEYFNDPRVAGAYTSGEHFIRLNRAYKGKRVEASTVLHEVVHGITVERLMTNQEYSTKIHNIFDEYMRQTKRYNPYYGESNIYEFIAEGLTDPEFQKELMNLEYRGSDKSLWNEFIDLIKAVWAPLSDNTLFDELFKTVMNPEGKDKVTSTFPEFKIYNQLRMDKIRGELKEAEQSKELEGYTKEYGQEVWDTVEAFANMPFQDVPELLESMEGYVPKEVLDSVLSIFDQKNRLEKIEYAKSEKEARTTLEARDISKTWEQKLDAAEKGDIREKPKDIALDWGKKVQEGFKDIAKGVTERLRTISPKLVAPIRKMEYSINKMNKEYRDRTDPFIKKYRGLSLRDKLGLDLALVNPSKEYSEKRDEILERNGMVEEFSKVKDVLADIHKEKGKEGLNKYKSLANYFPRRVKDVRGLMQAMKGSEDYNLIEAEMDKLGKDASEADKENAIKQMINTGRFPSIALLDPTSSKKRKIQVVSSEWLKYYESSVDSILHHIYESNESVYSHRAFGDSIRLKRVAERDRLGKLLEGKLTEKKRAKLFSEFSAMEAQLDNYDEDFNEGGLAKQIVSLAPELSMWEADEVVKSIRARLNQKGMSGPISTFRNLSLMSALGSPTSAITQIGDLAFSIYKNGPVDTIKALLGDKMITAEDLDLAGAMNEFQTQGTAKWLDKVLKWSGLQVMDQLGKNTFMESSLKKARKQTLEDFTKEWGDVLGQETEATWNDLQEGVKTERVAFFAFNALSDFQPVSLSEMPAKYLTAGNGRILYALKSYNIKALNTIYRESVNTWKKGKTPQERAKAMADVGRLVLLMTFMGATADELKDLLLGKDAGTFSEGLKDNLVKTAMLSRYTLEKGGGKGVIEKTITDIIMPPLNLIDDPIYDVVTWMNETEGDEDFRTLKSLPWGKLPYSWFSSAEEYSDMRNLRQEIVDSIGDGKSIGSVSSKVRDYNKKLRGLETPRSLKPINYGTLSRARRDYLKDQ